MRPRAFRALVSLSSLPPLEFVSVADVAQLQAWTMGAACVDRVIWIGGHECAELRAVFAGGDGAAAG